MYPLTSLPCTHFTQQYCTWCQTSHHSHGWSSGRLRSIHAVVPGTKPSPSEKGYTLITPVPTGAQTLCDADSQASTITPHSHNCTTTYVLPLSFSCHLLLHTLHNTHSLSLLRSTHYTTDTVQVKLTRRGVCVCMLLKCKSTYIGLVHLLLTHRKLQ